MLEFRVLGVLEVHGSAGAIPLGGAKQRLTLALLVLNAGRFVSREHLVDALWPEGPPPSAARTVESYVSRLRGVLRDAVSTGPVIEFAAAGYRLTREGRSFDHLAFATLVDAAREALARDDHLAVSASAREALGLWRGPALAGLAEEPALRGEAAALDEERMGAFELWAAAEVSLGRHAGLVAELSAQAGLYPARERLQELLMLALYRAGRQAEALEAYRRTRRHLVDELGLEPGPDLHALQERILCHDPSLTPAAKPAPEPVVAPAAALDGGRAPPVRDRRRLALSLVTLTLLVAAIVVTLSARGGSDAGALTATLRSPALGLLDADTGRQRGALELPAAPGRLAAGLGAVWATSNEDGALLRIDPGRNAVTQTIAVGHGPTGVAVAAGDVWVADTLDDTLLRVDGATNRPVQRIAVDARPTDVAAGAGAVWVANAGAGTVSRVDPRSGVMLGRTRLHSAPGGIAVGAGGVWVAESGTGHVARLDARTGRLRQRIRVGSGPSAVAVGPDGVWVANRLDATVSLIDPATDAVVLTREVPGEPAALATSGTRVWVATRDTPSLTRIVGASGLTQQVTLPSPASALATGPDGLVVGVRGLGLDHRGGTLVARTSYGLASVSPYWCCDVPPGLRAASYDGLLAFSSAAGSVNTLVPDLAVRIPRPEAGGRVYRFRLRAGLRYWTGAPVRAADVRRGLERAAHANGISAAVLSALPGARACPGAPRCDLSSSIAVNDRARTVTLRLSRPDPLLLLALGLPSLAPSPPGRGPPPGTGPYRIARFAPGRLVDLRRNRFFRTWAPAAQPAGYPDRILWRMGGTGAANVTAVLRGDADYTPDTPTHRQRTDILVRAPGRFHVVPLPGLDHLILNTRLEPFDDVRVRRALNFAVDRGAIARIFGGTDDARPICQVVAATVSGHESYCPYTRHPSRNGRWVAPDLARARRLVAASSTAGTPVSILVAGDSPDEPSASYLAGLLRRLGYPTRVRAVPSPRFGSAVVDVAHPPQAIATAWYGPPSAAVWVSLLLSCDAWDPPSRMTNSARFCDPVVDRWAAEATRLTATNPDASNRLWARADRRITDQAPWVSTVSESSTDLVSQRVGNYQQLPVGLVALDQLWVR